MLRDRSMDPGVGARKEGPVRREESSDKGVWPCGRVAVSELLDAAVEAARTSRQARPQAISSKTSGAPS